MADAFTSTYLKLLSQYFLHYSGLTDCIVWNESFIMINPQRIITSLFTQFPFTSWSGLVSFSSLFWVTLTTLICIMFSCCSRQLTKKKCYNKPNVHSRAQHQTMLETIAGQLSGAFRNKRARRFSQEGKKQTTTSK